MKVCDLPYERYPLEAAEAEMKKHIAAIRAAKNTDEVLAAREKLLKPYVRFVTMMSLSNMRYTLNTRDEFYNAEKQYYDENVPLFLNTYNEYGDAMLESPFRKELEKKLAPALFKLFEYSKIANDPRIVEERQKEAAITTEYSSLMSQMTFEMDGKKMPLTLLKAYLDDSDREVRKRAAAALGNGLMANSDKLDDIYDRLVHLRDAMAKKLGMKNYIELGYYSMNRIDYDRDMVGKFRNNVVEYIVPVVDRLKRATAAKLGIEDLKFYDNEICVLGGEPRPKLDKEGIFAAAKDMYREMDDYIGDFMERMLNAEAFDVESREGKWGGGYCTSFDMFAQPFILANFNGSSSDIDVITHEFGHALAMELSFTYGLPEIGVGSMETAECHSMSMEFFCYRFMDKFFDNSRKYEFKHCFEALSFLPYGCIVDEFQHIVYENPDLTPAQRDQKYLELEKKYRPFIDYEGIPYLEKGTRWQYQMHIYESPFYYIDYCLAQTVAFGFLLKAQEDFKGALNSYLEFCKKGGAVSFNRLVEDAGIGSPFAGETLKNIAAKIPAFLKELER